jgi:phosphohistidine phosphatase SixA
VQESESSEGHHVEQASTTFKRLFRFSSWALAAPIVIVGAQAAEAARACAAGETETTVLVVRHAEKTCRRCDELSEAGLTRAKLLPATVRPIAGELDAGYHSNTKRTRQTVAHLSPKPHTEYARNRSEREVVAGILKDRCGQSVLVAGHSNTAPQMVPLLGVPPAQIDVDNWFPTKFPDGTREIYHEDFDDLFVVKICGPCEGLNGMGSASFARAARPRDWTQRQLAGDLLRRAFEGSTGSLVMGALSAQKTSKGGLAELRRVLRLCTSSCTCG